MASHVAALAQMSMRGYLASVNVAQIRAMPSLAVGEEQWRADTYCARAHSYVFLRIKCFFYVL